MRDYELEQLVKEEAANLKQNATSEELGNLDMERLDTDSPIKCIYGLCTGSCFSKRANELIVNSAKRVYNHGPDGAELFRGVTLNGAPKPAEGRDRHYWSPIEYFIVLEAENDKRSNIEALVAYLKDETSTLEFN